MDVRALIGFNLMALGVMLYPFSHWLSIKFFPVSVTLFIIGAIIYYGSQIIDRYKSNNEEIPNQMPKNPNISLDGEIRDFDGSDAFDQHDD